MKTLVCDFDDVICNNDIINIVNDYLKTNYTFEDIGEGYDMSTIIDDEQKRREIFQHVVKSNFYENATLKPDAYRVLENLQQNHDYQVVICSACLVDGYEELCRDVYFNKYNFIYQNLPFIKPCNIVFTNSKGVMKGDCMIDDRMSNLEGKFKTKLLFDCWYNRKFSDEELNAKGVKRVHDWKEIEQILLNDKD